MNNYREPQINTRVYLNVPYNERNNAKELGCRWDSNLKKWYCIDSDYGKSNVSKCIEIWNQPEPYKIINGIPTKISNIPLSNRGYTA